MHRSYEPFARYAILTIIWVGVLAFVYSLTQAGSADGSVNVSAISIAALICAATATGFLLNPESVNGTQSEPQTEKPGKAKNDRHGVDPMSLLTDDDIAELREEIKYDLRRRLLQREDGELNSLDALLAEQNQAKRR